jgi:hypothetical protein
MLAAYAVFVSLLSTYAVFVSLLSTIVTLLHYTSVGTYPSADSPRTEMVLGYNFTHSHPSQGAMIIGHHKLIAGAQRFDKNASNSW